ncbi:MAG TPA: hypothetical protein VJQ26_08895 [Ktedonobacteraceae bacterium]|nr:hypothetical protein [Ktedonobacteraceae bacterium]
MARGIDIKDNRAAALPVENTSNGFRCPPAGKAVLLEEAAGKCPTK